jgi:integrase
MSDRFKFTKTAIAGLPIPAPGKRTTCYDTEVPKLALRITATGTRTFYVIKRAGSDMVWLKLGVFPDMTTEMARNEAGKALGAFAHGTNPAAARRALKQELTFAELFADYLKRHAKLRKRTWREDEQKYRDYLAEPIGRKKISRITRQDLGAIHASITRTGHPTLANRVKDLYSSVFGRAIEWGLMEHNPAKGIRDNAEKSRERFLQPSELPRFFAALSAEPNETIRDFVLIALLTGARRANVQTMRWRDVDLDTGIWHIPMTKNGQPQNVPLTPEAVEVLRIRRAAAADDAEYVYASSGVHGHLQEPRRAWQRILDRDELAQLTAKFDSGDHKFNTIAEETINQTLARARLTAKKLKLNIDGTRMTDLRIHDLRRTMGSWQARTGASMVIIGKSLGHKSHQATAVYARLDLDPVRQAMETATAAMLDAAGVKRTANVAAIRDSNADTKMAP